MNRKLALLVTAIIVAVLVYNFLLPAIILQWDSNFTEGKFTLKNKIDTRAHGSTLVWEYEYNVGGKRYSNYVKLPDNFHILDGEKYSIEYSKHCPDISKIELDHPIK